MTFKKKPNNNKRIVKEKVINVSPRKNADRLHLAQGALLRGLPGQEQVANSSLTAL
jgi:hypothetical protein